MNTKRIYEAVTGRILNENFKSIRMIGKDKIVRKTKKQVEITDTVKIISIHENCEYYKYRNLINGRIMIVDESIYNTTGYYRFKYDDDRKRLNSACGYSDKKTRYRFDNPKIA